MSRSDERSSCERACELMEAWIDGDLDVVTGEEMQHHVAACALCEAELRKAERVRATLRALPVFDLPPQVLDAVRSETVDRTGSAPAAGWRARPVLRPVGFAAAVAAAMVLAVVIRSGWNAPPPRPTAAEVERVTAETRLALAYLGAAARRAEGRLKTRVVEDRAVAATMKGVTSTLRWVRGPGTSTTKKIEGEGSP